MWELEVRCHFTPVIFSRSVFERLNIDFDKCVFMYLCMSCSRFNCYVVVINNLDPPFIYTNKESKIKTNL